MVRLVYSAQGRRWQGICLFRSAGKQAGPRLSHDLSGAIKKEDLEL